MTPKEKAIELCDKFDDITNSTLCAAKRCALIAVDEILIVCQKYLEEEGATFGILEFYAEVKQEIENL